MTTPDDEAIEPETARYPQVELSPAEFEVFVTSLFDPLKNVDGIDNLQIQHHEVIRGTDGAYNFDATVRYELAGMNILTLIEAKQHNHPIKRDLVQVLHSKQQSVGANKAVLISTAPFQKGAVAYATTHGIALVTVTEGRFTYETKSVEQAPPLTREEAAQHFGLPTFVGHCYSQKNGTDFITTTTVSAQFPVLAYEALAKVET
ncbi:hypothetical protein CH249_01330 [Rhodococcus sp. 05-2255-3B1]|uniref:restriction endonuclease n=1 Tax=unclassified Rhodococcus (in: high G+C Gram-positive bacteria) TaxID=192944 RepID=UPI000B9AFD82|nr:MULTISPECIES: restriction endonuclease [unclassified Rhodococcus (in: high G+C Gram-positive bacteria)]OZE13460.1 hypothetical protein CH250_06035 [Rhodococcus sp. 05-2255-3C]OZE15925.1 hypothetical protein CH249_01330 [Rhodococcus sp. 05-2255-3B1]OZE18964.1 hypothetical protein CH255_13355 [Rhodococcus sp. 05-2255-2A2]